MNDENDPCCWYSTGLIEVKEDPIFSKFKSPRLDPNNPDENKRPSGFHCHLCRGDISNEELKTNYLGISMYHHQSTDYRCNICSRVYHEIIKEGHRDFDESYTRERVLKRRGLIK